MFIYLPIYVFIRFEYKYVFIPNYVLVSFQVVIFMFVTTPNIILSFKRCFFKYICTCFCIVRHNGTMRLGRIRVILYRERRTLERLVSKVFFLLHLLELSTVFFCSASPCICQNSDLLHCFFKHTGNKKKRKTALIHQTLSNSGFIAVLI